MSEESNIENIEDRIQQAEKEIKRLKYLVIFLLVITVILTLLLIGEYTMIWGGAFIEDPNNPGLPLTQIILSWRC